MGQGDAGLIADRRAHGDHGRDTPAHQPLGDTGIGIARRGFHALARVEHRQPQRALIPQQGAEVLPAHDLGLAIFALEEQHAVLRLHVKAAVAEEVQDVIFLHAQLTLQA